MGTKILQNPVAQQIEQVMVMTEPQRTLGTACDCRHMWVLSSLLEAQIDKTLTRRVSA